MIDREEWGESLALACRWLTDVAMNRTDTVPPEVNRFGYDFASWQGAMLEYRARTDTWLAFGPHWHTGQAVKAFVLAHHILGDQHLIDSARLGADFILRERIRDPDDPDFGALLAYEGGDPGNLIAQTSGMMEALDGLILLAEHTGDERYWDAAIAALEWIQRRAVVAGDGLMIDDFHLRTREVIPAPRARAAGVPGRPLLDDGVFLKGFPRTGRAAFRETFLAVADRLLREERPPGNWIRFGPCNEEKGTIHPRHAYWWGRPLIMAWQETGDARFLECAVRCGHWYRQAQRVDGGLFRGTRIDFRTDSFGHAVSGILCAAILWQDLIAVGHGDCFREPLQLALDHARASQFVKTTNPNLHGAILEKVLPPDGTDRQPYEIRDLGTIFYVQALAMALASGPA